MKREIAGKILSEVRGVSDTNAAVAKELNATSTGNMMNVLTLIE